MSPCPLRVSVPAEPSYLKAIRGFFRPVLEQLFGDGAEQVILALDESCSNVLKHGPQDGPTSLDVEADVLDTMIRFRIGDFCGASEVARVKPRALMDVRPGGLGMHFVHATMDRVAFDPQPECPGRVCLVLEKSFAPAEDADQPSKES